MSSDNNSNEIKISKAKVASSVRAGTVFPVGRVVNKLRAEGIASGCSTRTGAALAASLDEIFVALLSSSVQACLVNNKPRITPRLLKIAIANDVALAELFDATIPRGGVLPNIHRILLPKAAREV